VVEKEHDTVGLRPEVFEKTFDVFATVKILGQNGGPVQFIVKIRIALFI
jgi:hypothetical protein